MMSYLLFLAVCLVTCVSAHAQCSNTSPCPFKGGDDFIQPEEKSSVDGKLEMTLTVDVSDVTVEWLTFTRRTYNGGWPSPSLRVRAGDQVDLLLKNNLGDSQAEGEPNTFRHPNTTNLHVHGLHISPREPQDDVLIEPKRTLEDLQREVTETQEIVRDIVEKKLAQRDEKLRDLTRVAENLEKAAEQFEKVSKKVRFKMWLRSRKWTVCTVSTVVVVLSLGAMVLCVIFV